MKVRNFTLFYSIIFLALALSACSDKSFAPPGEGNYNTGIFVVNEGLFGGTGTVSWVNPADGSTVHDVFGKANDGAALGSIVQSLYLHDNRAYVVVNGANTVYVVDATTFEYIDTIGNLHLPRFFIPAGNGFAYISQWGDDGLTGSLAKVDLSTNRVVKTIPVGTGPEKMLIWDQKIYAANSGGFGVDSTISVVDLNTDQEINRIEVDGTNPSSILDLQAGEIYVLSKGYFLDPTPEGTFEITPPTGFSQTLPPYGDDLCLDPITGYMYFHAGGNIYQYTRVSNAQAFIQQNVYGVNCHPETGTLYCTDPKDFNSNGELIEFDSDGNIVRSYSVGIAPGEIVFVD